MVLVCMRVRRTQPAGSHGGGGAKAKKRGGNSEHKSQLVAQKYAAGGRMKIFPTKNYGFLHFYTAIVQ